MTRSQPMRAEELRQMREVELLARRSRRAFEAALGGRSALVAPITKTTRTIGGVQPPSIGVVAELGETVVFQQRGPLIADLSNPYRVIRGGAPLLLMAAALQPTGMDLDILRNGVVVDSITPAFAAFGGAFVAEALIEEVYIRGDIYRLEVTDPGTGGDGMTVATEFRPSLS